MRRVRRNKQGLRAEMNIVPYVDVMFVLLTIFMVTATTIPIGVEINAPEIETTLNDDSIPTVDDYVMISVDKDGQYFMSDTEDPEAVLDIEELIRNVDSLNQLTPNTEVFIRADKDAPYGKLIEAMGRIRASTDKKVRLTTPQSI